MPKTKAERISKIVEFYPHKTPAPELSKQEAILEAATNLTEALKSYDSAQALTNSKVTSQSLHKLAEIFLFKAKRPINNLPAGSINHRKPSPVRRIANDRVPKDDAPDARVKDTALTNAMPDARVLTNVSPALPLSDRAIRAATRAKVKESRDLSLKPTPLVLILSATTCRDTRLLHRNEKKTATQFLSPPISVAPQQNRFPLPALITRTTTS